MTDENQQDPNSEITEPDPQSGAGGTIENQENPYDAMADISRRQPVEEPPKPARNSIFIYAVILAGIGVLVGAVYFTMPGLFGNAKGRYDLGTVVSSPDGLNGHLYTRWVGQLEYRLKIEPGDQHQLARIFTRRKSCCRARSRSISSSLIPRTRPCAACIS